MTSKLKMPIGLDAALPLQEDNEDLFYKLHKTLKDNIKQNIRMLMYTSPGERVMVPNYGIGIRNYLFEQSPEREIRNRIQQQTSTYIPQISIVSLNITRDNPKTIAKIGQSNTLFIELIYDINGYNIRDAVQLVETSPN
tara:strand:- start:39 stop:455 length:417 start_codon:yes stop_codon:yes gene_type:complete